MENKEILTNEEVVKTTEELLDTGNGASIAVGTVILLLGAGALAYNFVIRPVVAKIKAKKEECDLEEVVVDLKDQGIDIVEED